MNWTPDQHRLYTIVKKEMQKCISCRLYDVIHKHAPANLPAHAVQSVFLALSMHYSHDVYQINLNEQ